MTDKSLAEWYHKNSNYYRELVDVCGSVAELKLRLIVMNSRWTQWDWIFFFKYLVSDAARAGADQMYFFRDVLNEITSGEELDSVVQNKSVVLSFVESASSGAFSNFFLMILARVFQKFPSMWNMNYMWTKRRGKRAVRVHRLAFTCRGPAEYYTKRQFLDDFVARYFTV